MNDISTLTDKAFNRLIQSNNQFAIDLLKRLRTESNDNIFFAPSSIAFALGMTYVGTSGDSAREIEDTMYWSRSRENNFTRFRELRKQLPLGSNAFQFANRLWMQIDYPIRKQFLQTLKIVFDAEPALVDFRQGDVVSQINDWISDQTQGTIEEAVRRQDIDRSTVLVLVNAIYFKGMWKWKFNESNSRHGFFHGLEARPQRATFMNNTGDYLYTETSEFQILTLPFTPIGAEGDQVELVESCGDIQERHPSTLTTLEMEIFLPKSTDCDIKLHLAPELLGAPCASTETRVHVSLPRFTFETYSQLSEVLTQLGISEIFDPGKANFSEITDDPAGLYVSKVIHKARIQVNEQGAEASAATIVVASRGASSNTGKHIIFTADHPFVFTIRDSNTGLIHFMGYVNAPTEN